MIKVTTIKNIKEKTNKLGDRNKWRTYHRLEVNITKQSIQSNFVYVLDRFPCRTSTPLVHFFPSGREQTDFEIYKKP